MTPRYRAALVDLDDTLFDHQAHRREALSALSESIPSLRGVKLPDLESSHETHLLRTHTALLNGQFSLAQARLARMRGLLSDFGAQADETELEEYEHIYRRAYDREWRAVP